MNLILRNAGCRKYLSELQYETEMNVDSGLWFCVIQSNLNRTKVGTSCPLETRSARSEILEIVHIWSLLFYTATIIWESDPIASDRRCRWLLRLYTSWISEVMFSSIVSIVTMSGNISLSLNSICLSIFVNFEGEIHWNFLHLRFIKVDICDSMKIFLLVLGSQFHQ